MSAGARTRPARMASATRLAACDACLRRSALIAALAPWLEIEWRRRSAPSGVLSLPDEALLGLDAGGAALRTYAEFSATAARERIAAAGLTAVCRCAGPYPEQLRELADPPAVLHVAGDLAALPQRDAVAIVGARRGTAYGREVARGLGRGVTAAGVPVVSGLALGIDSAAHVGALAVVPEPPGGARPAVPPVAVLAGGADVPYPPSARGLYARVVEHGCVVAELPPGFRARRWCFVARNRIIAGLAGLTVVVEGAERSGSLTTADFAEQLGRAVAAVPGPVTSRFSAGTNALLAAGAGVVRHAEDVLDQLAAATGTVRAAAPAMTGPPLPAEPRLRKLLEAVERGHGSLAELAADAATSRTVLADLTELELRGLITRGFGGRYVRSAGGGP